MRHVTEHRADNNTEGFPSPESHSKGSPNLRSKHGCGVFGRGGKKDGRWVELQVGFNPLCTTLELKDFPSIDPMLGLKNTYFQPDADFPGTVGVR